MRTRIKICGITREQDIASAARSGADAVGLVFYAPSPRCVDVESARQLAASAPIFVSVAALFVNPQAAEVEAVVERVRPHLLQFHGGETAQFCESFGVPYVKAVRMAPTVDLLQYARDYAGARALLLDAHVEGYGGGGMSFRLESDSAVFAVARYSFGGLHAENIVEAVRRVRPWAVDVSSGVEAAKGIKDEAKIAAFCAGVRHADG